MEIRIKKGKIILPIIMLLYAILDILLSGVSLTGIYTVQPDEQGVVQIFGKVTNPYVKHGVHWTLPYPLAKVTKIKVKEVKRLSVGYLTNNEDGYIPSGEQQFITGDMNIINIKAMIQYSIKNPVQYIFCADTIDSLVKFGAEQALTEVLAAMNVDQALTEGKVVIQNKVKEKIQDIFDLHQSGLLMISFYLNEVYPPLQVENNFKDVWIAKQNKDRKLHEAYGYRNQQFHLAQGQANKIIKEAEAYSTRRINLATGEAERFNKRYSEYYKAKDITVNRLYYETLEKILPNIQKVVTQD